MSKEREMQDGSWKYDKYKELEKLFAWAQFYRVNRHDDKYAKIQVKIEELRSKLFKN